jgi:hypothetical protein
MPGPSSIHRTLSCGGYSGSTRLLPSNPKATGPHEPVAWDPASCLYDLPILSVLDGMGGAGSAPEVIDAVDEMVEEKLTENDLMERRREMEEPCCLAPLPPRPARPARAQQPARHVGGLGGGTRRPRPVGDHLSRVSREAQEPDRRLAFGSGWRPGGKRPKEHGRSTDTSPWLETIAGNQRTCSHASARSSPTCAGAQHSTFTSAGSRPASSAARRTCPTIHSTITGHQVLWSHIRVAENALRRLPQGVAVGGRVGPVAKPGGV